MVVEVAGHQGNVEIAGFPNRLAVVHALQDREQPRVLLERPGDGVEVSGPRRTPELPPRLGGGARSRHRPIHVLVAGLGDIGEAFPRGGVPGREDLSRRSPLPPTGDVQAEAPTTRFQPLDGALRTLGRRAVLH